MLKTKIRNFIMFTLGVVAPATAYAAPGWTVPATITQIITTESSLTVVLAGANNPMSCGVSTWFRLQTTAANYQAITANLMTAKAQGKNVEVWVSACDPDGASSITAAWLIN